MNTEIRFEKVCGDTPIAPGWTSTTPLLTLRGQVQLSQRPEEEALSSSGVVGKYGWLRGWAVTRAARLSA